MKNNRQKKGFPYEEPMTKEKARARKLLFVTAAIGVPILFIGMMLLKIFLFHGEYAWQISFREYNEGLYDALCGAFLGCYVVFMSYILIVLIGTWLNVRKSNLKHAILGIVGGGYGVSWKYYDPKCKDASKFCEATDEKIVFVETFPLKFHFLTFFISAISMYLFLRNLNYIELGDGTYLCFFILSFCIFLTNLLMPKRRIEFNRIKGTLTYSCFIFPWHCTIKFDKVSINAYDYQFRVAIPYRLNPITLIGKYNESQNWWSFYIWYMDKNRPLPVGTLFNDSYRERDFERRKSEGFPPPLYPASFDMEDSCKGESHVIPKSSELL